MPNTQKFLSSVVVKVAGSVPQGLSDDLVEVSVELTLNIPDMFTLRLHDDAFKWIDGDTFALGKAVDISAKPAQDIVTNNGTPSEKLLISGEVTALEPEFNEKGEAILVVRGYAKGHRLHRGKKTRTFLKMKDSDIASKIIGEAGLSANVTATSVQHDYVIQSNQTDMEFLRYLATRNHYNVYTEGSTVSFTKADTSRGDAPQLTWKENLTFFRPTVAATHQVNKVLVRGWDLKTKKEVVGQATPNSTLAAQVGGNYSPGSASQAFGGQAQSQVVSQLVTTRDEAQAMAESLVKDIQKEMVQAEGRCLGEPGLKPGYQVKIDKVGTRFSGKYTLTTVTHVYTPEHGYETSFSVSGRQPDTVTSILGLGNGHQSSDSGDNKPFVAIAVVTNNNDPDNLGRVKMKFPWLSDQDESHWVRVVSLGAGQNRGIMWLPEVNDEVLVAFAHGDIRQPYVIGGLWNGKDAPPLKASEAVAGGKVEKRIIQTRVGHQIILHDKSGEEFIHIIDKTGKNKIVINTAQNTITIQSDKDIKIEAQKDISMEAKTGNITFKCAQSLKMDCMKLEVSATGTGEIKANGSLTVKSSGATSVEGSLMTLKSNGPLKATGTPIMLN